MKAKTPPLSVSRKDYEAAMAVAEEFVSGINWDNVIEIDKTPGFGEREIRVVDSKSKLAKRKARGKKLWRQ